MPPAHKYKHSHGNDLVLNVWMAAFVKIQIYPKAHAYGGGDTLPFALTPSVTVVCSIPLISNQLDPFRTGAALVLKRRSF